MERRQFIQAAVLPLLIPHALGWAREGGAEPRRPADYAFYDSRFAKAREIAAAWADAADLIPVAGDVTALWKDGLGRACGASPLLMRGITTESFHFCLGVLAREKAGTRSRVTRVDRDLHLWTIRTG